MKDNINQLKPVTTGVAVGMNGFRENDSPSRLYMLGKNQGKAAVIWGSTNRKNPTGEEYEYAKTARKVELESEVEIEEVFFIRDIKRPSEPSLWGAHYVIVRDLETGFYDLLEMPKFSVQNMDLGFEYKYDKEKLRSVKKGARFHKGTVFAQSARITETNEWCPGIETRVAAMSHVYTEEDAVFMFESYAKKVGVTFRRRHEHQWNEEEYVPLNLYGTLDNPQPFPLPGERVRSDGIIMGFRKKDPNTALVGLTKKALMNPDDTYDKLYFGTPNSIVADVTVETDRYKNQANNKRAEKRTQPHTVILEAFETEANRFYNEVVRWYKSKQKAFVNKRPPITEALENFILFAQGSITRDYTTNNSNGKFNTSKRKFGNIVLKDWRVIVLLKEDVEGKTRFKNTGMDGNKSIIMKILPDEFAPVDDYGERADMVVGNTPSFRRQIFGSLMELDINFIGIRIYKEIKELILTKQYDKAWEKAYKFYDTISPDFALLANELNADERIEHLEHIAKDENEFSVSKKSDSKITGIEIIERLEKEYGHIKPTPVTYINAFGQTVRTRKPIVISSLYYIMLDKFGDDISCQSTPKLNIFGLPTSLSKFERARSFHRAQLNRNIGETEGRLYINQKGGAAAVRAIALANSPELLEEATKRIIRADNPFLIDQLTFPGEEVKNHTLQIISNILGDFGITLRNECETDRT